MKESLASRQRLKFALDMPFLARRYVNAWKLTLGLFTSIKLNLQPFC